MTDDFVPVILGALAAAEPTAVDVATDEISTYLSGDEASMATFIVTALTTAAASTRTGHVVASVLLSRGCPGEISCEPPAGRVPAPPPPVSIPPTGVMAAAHWSVYPLGVTDHMAAIDAAVSVARRTGTLVRGEHYVTRLAGDVAAVTATVVNGWLAAGATATHVTSHATISIGSPTRTGSGSAGDSERQARS